MTAADLHDLPPLLEVKHAMAITGMSKNTVYALVSSGEIPSVRLGSRIRIPRDQLLAQLGLLDEGPTDEDDEETRAEGNAARVATSRAGRLTEARSSQETEGRQR